MLCMYDNTLFSYLKTQMDGGTARLLFLLDFVSDLWKESQNSAEENVLQYYAKVWRKYMHSSVAVARLLSELELSDRKVWMRGLAAHDERETRYAVHHLAMVTWRDGLFLPLHAKITNAALKLIEDDRKGVSIDADLVHSVVRSSIEAGTTANEDRRYGDFEVKWSRYDLKWYRDYFEKPFLEATERFYTSESMAFMKRNSISQYLKKADQWLREERERVRTYLHESTEDELMRICGAALITKYLDSLYDGIPHLAAAGDHKSLSLIHSLLSRFECRKWWQIKSLRYISLSEFVRSIETNRINACS